MAEEATSAAEARASAAEARAAELSRSKQARAAVEATARARLAERNLGTMKKMYDGIEAGATSRRSPRRTPNNNSQSTTTDFLTAPDTVHKPKYWGVSFIPTFTNAWNNRLSPTLQLLADLQSFKAKVSSRMDLTILLYKPNKTKRARK